MLLRMKCADYVGDDDDGEGDDVGEDDEDATMMIINMVMLMKWRMMDGVV